MRLPRFYGCIIRFFPSCGFLLRQSLHRKAFSVMKGTNGTIEIHNDGHRRAMSQRNDLAMIINKLISNVRIADCGAFSRLSLAVHTQCTLNDFGRWCLPECSSDVLSLDSE